MTGAGDLARGDQSPRTEHMLESRHMNLLRMMSRAVVGLAGVLGIVYACAAGAADPVLAPTGTLRAAYIVANLAQARLDSGTGAITGVVADITRELGRRAG